MDTDARRNQLYWDRTSDEYQDRHARSLGEHPEAWGVWRIPECELRALGDLTGATVLELGCGAAQWSHAIAARAGRVVGMDLSGAQLRHARGANDAGRVHLVQADAHHLPFADASFDLVFSDHGATTFADPEHALREVARVLRDGGHLVFCQTSPWFEVCYDAAEEKAGTTLLHSYFDLGRIEDQGLVLHQRSYSGWVRLFRDCGLWLEAMWEPRPEPDQETSYRDYADRDWARRFPMEVLWRLVKFAAPSSPPR